MTVKVMTGDECDSWKMNRFGLQKNFDVSLCCEQDDTSDGLQSSDLAEAAQGQVTFPPVWPSKYAAHVLITKLQDIYSKENRCKH